jgi:hypothetical protein
MAAEPWQVLVVVDDVPLALLDRVRRRSSRIGRVR